MELTGKWTVRLAALAIFVLGFTGGMLTFSIYNARRAPAASEQRRQRFEQIIEKLDLSEEQSSQVRAIMDDVRSQLRDIHRESQPRVSDVRQQARERLQKVLTPDQWDRFQQLMKQSRDSRRSGRGGDDPR